MTAKEILYKKCQDKDDGFLSGQVSWIAEAMEEYANQETEKLRDELKEMMSLAMDYRNQIHSRELENATWRKIIREQVQQVLSLENQNKGLVELVKDLEPIMIAWAATTSHGLEPHPQHQEVLNRINKIKYL